MIVLLLAGAAHAQRANQGEDESAAFVEEGRTALRRGQLDDAAKALDQAITLNPRRVEAYVLRAAVYDARKQYTDGIALLRKAQTLAPTDNNVLDALGSALVLAGQREEGIPLLQQVVAKEPARFDAQLLLGHYFHDAGKWPDAIAAFEAYFASRPAALEKEDAHHEIELGDSYLRYRQPQKALALFERASQQRRGDLRARIGAAWATAAIDCKRARTMLHDLEPLAEQHPEIWLVDGQCALALGDPGGALALGKKYLEREAKASAAGHALVGEAQAARGNLADARKELETARELEPARRRWTVRLAIVLRRAGKPADAAAALDKLGPPATPTSDPDWWTELGEALLAQGDATAAISRLAPVVPELPGDAAVRTVLGAAQLQQNQIEAAAKTLDEAEAIGSTPRSKKLLATALTALAAAKLAANDAAAAEPLLSRAEPLDPGNPVILRDLGIAQLALNKPGDAAATLDRAIKIDTSATTFMLAARAHAVAGDLTAARPLYDRALAAAKDDGVEIAIDWAATELQTGGDPALAVAALEKTAPPAKSPLAARHKLALAEARHAAGLAALRAGNAAKALELLRASAQGENTLATRCDVAVAAVAANDTTAAITALKAIAGQACPFPPPADTQAAPILLAFTDGLNRGRAGKALDKLTSLTAKATGPAAALLGTSIRVVALEAASDAYRSGDLGAARKYLATARTANAKVGADEVAMNLAVLDLADGKTDAAITQLERLAPKLPEALVNLGIAYERKGDHARALDAWRRARKAGTRFPQLPEWIEAKERIYGAEQ
ncbi:MAG: tetratricopeptide repeat protein [Deltaproteobacteria bacterium]|nr:tetratricopeptide repeat protein [Deltaproteobacteria bacterium]